MALQLLEHSDSFFIHEGKAGREFYYGSWQNMCRPVEKSIFFGDQNGRQNIQNSKGT
jgi:hypothetical protein